MPKYRIGVRAHDYGKLRPEQLMEAIAKDGWEGVQLAMPKAIAGVESFGEVDADITEKVRRAAERYGERIFVLGVYVDLGQADEIMRKAAVKTFLSQLSCAKALGAACIGSETTNWMQQPAGTTRQQGLRQVIRSMEEILPEADRLGVTVALEAGYEHTMNTPEAVKEILASLPGNHIRMIFDPGNLLGTGMDGSAGKTVRAGYGSLRRQNSRSPCQRHAHCEGREEDSLPVFGRGDRLCSDPEGDA
jgi:L-ribulose-5-phosphate 3-epimerase